MIPIRTETSTNAGPVKEIPQLKWAPNAMFLSHRLAQFLSLLQQNKIAHRGRERKEEKI